MANPVTHLEKTIAGEVQPVTHLEKVIAEYGGGNVYESLEAGTNILIEETADGKAKISASGEVSSEDTVARAAIAEMKDGTNIDSFGDVETALATKANADNVYKLALTTDDLLPANTDLDDVKTVGCYYVVSAATVQTITNKPANGGAFRLTVELAAGTIRPRQIYQEFNSYDKYIRYETSSATWANWKKVECDLSTKQDTISDLSTIRSGAALGATAVQPETGKGLSTNDYTTAEKTKLAGIEAQANKTTVDDALSGSSTNPVQNKVVKTALDDKANASTTYTKTEVDTALGGKQNAIDSSHKLSADLVEDTNATNKFATAAELEQIQTNKNNISSLYNSGQKNYLSINTSTYTASGSNRALKIPVDSISGTIHIYFGEITSTDTDDTTCGVLLLDSNDNTIQTVQFGRGTNKDVSVYVGNTAVASVSIYPATNWTNSADDTVSITNGMICSQDAWDATGGSYEPYAMSNAAITAWIIAHS